MVILESIVNINLTASLLPSQCQTLPALTSNKMMAAHAPGYLTGKRLDVMRMIMIAQRGKDMNRVTHLQNHLKNQLRNTSASRAGNPTPPTLSWEQVLCNILEHSPLGLYWTDLTGEVPFPSGATTRENRLRLTAGERKALTESFRCAMESEAQWSQRFCRRAADGHVRWFETVIAKLRDENGTQIGYQGFTTDVTHEVHEKHEVAINEERQRLAIEAAELGIWDLDVLTGNCFFSPYCYEMLGYAPGQMQGSLADWINIIHPEYLDNARRSLEECIEGRIDKFELEFRLKTNEGKWRWFRCTGKAATRDASGRGFRLAGTLLDVNQDKLMEHLLRMEHDLLNLITATSPVGIMFIEPDGNTAFANPRAERILGLAKKEMLTSGDWSLLRTIRAPENDGGEEESLEDVLRQGVCLQNSCFLFVRPDGSSVFLSISTAPFLDKASKVSGTVVTLEDVTEQKRREQVISDNDHLLQETQRIAQLGSYVLDLEQQHWGCSSKLREILGINEHYPMTLQGHFDLVHEEFRPRFVESYRSAIAHCRPFEMEYKIKRHSDGEERWVTECCEVTRDTAGKKRRTIGTIKDITERKAAEEAIRNLNNELDRRVIERTSQLVAAKKEIESFSYSVSHDLRAPLRHINSYSSILVEEHGAALPDEARYYLERICTASNRMGKQIDDLLALTRVGRAIMKRTTFNISQLAAEVVDMIQDDDASNAAEFVVHPAINAYGDAALVRLVLQNLLGNSVKYSSRNPYPRIEFGQTTVNGASVFFVRDNGVGFDMAYVEKLFQPFQRLHGSEFEGTGIGLATVRRIIERHGGSIWAEGKEGEGATFYFTLSHPRKA